MIRVMNVDFEKEIGEAEKLYDVGDYRESRRIALKLRGDERLEEEARQRLQRILEATQIDPVVIMAMIFTLFVILFIVLKYAF